MLDKTWILTAKNLKSSAMNHFAIAVKYLPNELVYRNRKGFLWLKFK